MTKLAKVKLCDVCRLDGGWHYADDGTASRCPNIGAAKVHAHAMKLSAEANEKAMQAAKEIIADFARTRRTFSGNDTRATFEAANVPTPVIGAAFHASAALGLIRNSGRYEQSTESSTRHRIVIWESVQHLEATA